MPLPSHRPTRIPDPAGNVVVPSVGTPSRPPPLVWEGTLPPAVPGLSSALPPTAIALLKDREPGAFIIRDSHSFRGAYGLAMKVASPPPTVMQQNKKGIVRPPASHAGMLAIVRPRTSGQAALLSSDVPLSMR